LVGMVMMHLLVPTSASSKLFSGGARFPDSAARSLQRKRTRPALGSIQGSRRGAAP
jgi:hypothetical protein